MSTRRLVTSRVYPVGDQVDIPVSGGASGSCVVEGDGEFGAVGAVGVEVAVGASDHAVAAFVDGVVVAGADDLEEAEVSVPETSEVGESSVKIVSPDKDSETTILRRYADARLAVGSLEAMGRGYPWSSEQSEQERETRENRDESYFETCRYHGASHFLL